MAGKPLCGSRHTVRVGHDCVLDYHRSMLAGRRLALAGFVAGALLSARDFGPAVGTPMPAFELRDQNGAARTMKSLLGPKGALILFFRSADW
jgi:hypothetical protein